MKNWFACAVVLAMLLGCSKKKEQTPVPAEPALTEEDVMPFLRLDVYQVAEWYSVKGQDTAFLSRDSVYESAFVKAVFLQFGDGHVFYYSGYEFPNTEFIGVARTFYVNRKFLRESNMTYSWDQTMRRLVIKTDKSQGMVPFLKPDLEVSMDASGFNIIKDLDLPYLKHQSGSMRFTYQENGRTNTLILKQMWGYPRHNVESHSDNYVVF